MESSEEYFTVSLEPFRTDTRVRLSTERSTVQITDNDSQCSGRWFDSIYDQLFPIKGVIIQMEQSSYRVSERGGATVVVCVRMLGQSSIYNTVYFSTVPSSAGITDPQLKT